MPRKGYVKPGGRKDQQDTQKRSDRALKGLDKAMDAIIKKLDAGKPLTDEETRFIKKYGDTRASILAKDDTKEPEGLPPGKLRDDIERLWKLCEIQQRSGYSRDREGYEQVLIDFGLYRCDTCGEAHPSGLVCPFEQLASKLDESIKAPTDRDLDSLLP